MCFPSGVHSFTSPNGFYSVYDVCILNALFVCTNGFYSVYDVCILNQQFVCTYGFYSVYRRICFPSGTSCHSFTFI